MIINHNLSAINAHRQLKINAFNMDKSMETLASGLRINRARDDAAGLAVSEKMRSQIRGLHQASRNAQDGISLIQTAEGWLQETQAVLQRMRELAVQSANGTYTNEDRMQIQVEIYQLIDEVDRISSHAEFNKHLLLRGAYTAPNASAFDGAHSIYYNEAPEPGGLWVHVGANMDQREKVFINNMNATSLKLTSTATGSVPARMAISLSTIEKANIAIGTLDQSLAKVSKERANLGAFQNRLEHTIRGVDIAAENLQSAESKIRDTDMAEKLIEYVKDQILSQSSSSMLAQANLRSQIVLKILG